MALTTSFNLVMISTVFFLTNNTLANSDCPDDGGNTNPVTGCPTGDVLAIMLSFPPYVMLKDGENETVLADGIVFDYLQDSFERCCPDSLPVSIVNNLEVDTESQSFHDDLKLADIIFPVTEKLETQLTFSGIGYTFHDIVKAHGMCLLVALITTTRKPGVWCCVRSTIRGPYLH